MTQLVATDQSFMPVMRTQEALMRYQAQKDFIDGVMRANVDYGVIPGTQKPTLLKPGAEKLCTFFGLSVHFEVIRSIEDWTGEAHGGEPMFYYWYRCILARNGQHVADAEGSCNSREAKYRWRDGKKKCPDCGQAAIIKGKAEYGGGWICFAKKGGCGHKFKDNDEAITSQPTGRAPNEDIADAVNTLQKMAAKRALVAAALIGTNASEYFTADVEDFIDADYTPAPEQRQERKDEPKAEAQKAAPAAKAPAPIADPKTEPVLTTAGPSSVPSLEDAMDDWRKAWAEANKAGIRGSRYFAGPADNISSIVIKANALRQELEARKAKQPVGATGK